MGNSQVTKKEEEQKKLNKSEQTEKKIIHTIGLTNPI